ncbi:hypothetical protein C8035_v005804 [Colletotrichum spinosum]|uniref:Uncharacterized protein n=1 Tax=Colletotrichum spinosum TaxID=1347390 RepID=A0A4R8QI97_9PEZI|nr:hypothetical protein C8035_v005804 [Colletotrichum spinosum]
MSSRNQTAANLADTIVKLQRNQWEKEKPYSMMALLYETVPTFEDTWIECLGDLGRYRR